MIDLILNFVFVCIGLSVLCISFAWSFKTINTIVINRKLASKIKKIDELDKDPDQIFPDQLQKQLYEIQNKKFGIFGNLGDSTRKFEPYDHLNSVGRSAASIKTFVPKKEHRSNIKKDKK